jgi:hypothetical protein
MWLGLLPHNPSYQPWTHPNTKRPHDAKLMSPISNRLLLVNVEHEWFVMCVHIKLIDTVIFAEVHGTPFSFRLSAEFLFPFLLNVIKIFKTSHVLVNVIGAAKMWVNTASVRN